MSRKDMIRARGRAPLPQMSRKDTLAGAAGGPFRRKPQVPTPPAPGSRALQAPRRPEPCPFATSAAADAGPAGGRPRGRPVGRATEGATRREGERGAQRGAERGGGPARGRARGPNAGPSEGAEALLGGGNREPHQERQGKSCPRRSLCLSSQFSLSMCRRFPRSLAICVATWWNFLGFCSCILVTTIVV